MKLQQLKRDDCVKIVTAYVQEYRRVPGLDQCVTKLMKSKRYQYNGPMYRALIFDPKLVVDSADVRLLTSHLHKQILKDKNEKYQSWCPTIKTLRATLTNNTDGMYPNSYGPWPFFVLEQNGVGLRATNLDPEIFNSRALDGEDEILAPIQNDVHLSGFVVGDPGKQFGVKYFDKEQFGEFIKLTRERYKKWVPYIKKYGDDRDKYGFDYE